MNLYYYCSYSTSPVGYQIGTLTYTEGQTENYQLSAENIPPLIRSCFEDGMIQKAAGKLPTGSGRYFLMIKNLTAKSEGNDALTYYLNLALETENFSEFEHWLRESGDSKEILAEAVRSTMDLEDQNNGFGFSVRSAETAKLVHQSFRALFPVQGRKQWFCLELKSAQTRLERLDKLFDLPADKMFGPIKDHEKWVGVKKKRNLLLAAIPLAAVVLILTLIWAWTRMQYAG